MYFCQRLRGCQRTNSYCLLSSPEKRGRENGSLERCGPRLCAKARGRQETVSAETGSRVLGVRRAPEACVPETSFPGLLLSDEWSPKMLWWTWENQNVRGWRCLWVVRLGLLVWCLRKPRLQELKHFNCCLTAASWPGSFSWVIPRVAAEPEDLVLWTWKVLCLINCGCLHHCIRGLSLVPQLSYRACWPPGAAQQVALVRCDCVSKKRRLGSRHIHRGTPTWGHSKKDRHPRRNQLCQHLDPDF